MGRVKMAAPLRRALFTRTFFSSQNTKYSTTAIKQKDLVPGGTQTHTGQKYDGDDYRNVRFINTPKQTNERWAINLIAEQPVKKVTTRVTTCDGGKGPLGHPRVFINVDMPGSHACGYCGLRFELDHH